MLRRILAPALAIAAIIGLIRLFRVVQRYDPALQREHGGGPEYSVNLRDATIVSRDGGVTRWSVQAGDIEIVPEPGGGIDNFRSARFEDVKNGVLYRGGKPEAFFAARHAAYDQANQTFTITGKLHLGTPKGDRLDAEECVWSEREDFLRLPKGANGRFQGSTVTAPLALFSPRHRILQCPTGAQGVLDGDPVQAAGLFWDVNSGQVHCLGPISGRHKGLGFEAQEAFVDLKTGILRANKGVAHLRIGDERDLPENL